MLIWFIVACEVGFWVILALGLFVRYVLNFNKLSQLILLCVPLVDIALLIATTIDLSSGKSAQFAHGLAAFYLGFTVVYGHNIIKWADAYVSYKFYSGDDPKNTTYGLAYAKYEWLQWLRGVMACAIAVSLLAFAVFYIDNPPKTEALVQWFSYMFWIMAVWLVCWPLWYSLFPKKEAEI